MGFVFAANEGVLSKWVALAHRHVEGCHTIEQLVFNWLGAEQSVLFLGGTNDETGEPASFLILIRKGVELGHVEFRLALLRALYADVLPATLQDAEEKLGTEVYIADDPESLADSIKATMSYLFRGHSEVEMVMRGTLGLRLLCNASERIPLTGMDVIEMYLSHQDPTTMKGFAEFRTILRPVFKPAVPIAA